MMFVSCTTIATISADEIDRAVPRNSDATVRSAGSGSGLKAAWFPTIT